MIALCHDCTVSVARSALLNCCSAVLVVLVHLCLGLTDIYPVAPLVLLGLWSVTAVNSIARGGPLDVARHASVFACVRVSLRAWESGYVFPCCVYMLVCWRVCICVPVCLCLAPAFTLTCALGWLFNFAFRYPSPPPSRPR